MTIQYNLLQHSILLNRYMAQVQWIWTITCRSQVLQLNLFAYLSLVLPLFIIFLLFICYWLIF